MNQLGNAFTKEEQVDFYMLCIRVMKNCIYRSAIFAVLLNIHICRVWSKPAGHFTFSEIYMINHHKWDFSFLGLHIQHVLHALMLTLAVLCLLLPASKVFLPERISHGIDSSKNVLSIVRNVLCAFKIMAGEIQQYS